MIAASPWPRLKPTERAWLVRPCRISSFVSSCFAGPCRSDTLRAKRLRRMKNADTYTIESILFLLYTRRRPAGRATCREEGRRWSRLSRARGDAHRTAIVHTLMMVDVPFDQISLFELQRRLVMKRQGALVKRTRKKRNLANEGGFVRTLEPMWATRLSYLASFFFPKFQSFASLVCCSLGAAQPFFSCWSN